MDWSYIKEIFFKEGEKIFKSSHMEDIEDGFVSFTVQTDDRENIGKEDIKKFLDSIIVWDGYDFKVQDRDAFPNGYRSWYIEIIKDDE